MHILKQLTAMILFLIIIFVSVPASAAEEMGQFDLDIIFVIDNSRSMNEADPNKLSLTAANLFIDMCEGTDSRAGYVMYTHIINAKRDLTDLISFNRDIKKEIAGMTFDGWTDITLGLETAIKMFAREAEMGTNIRKPTIILLGDGNTELDPEQGHPRSTEASQEAMRDVLNDAFNMKIPVYTIGFNFDGSLDISTMRDIARSTSGIMRETQDASELPVILRDIYSDLTGARSITIPASPITGEPQSVIIPIKDNSIHRAIITIMSSKPVNNVSFINPNGDPGTYTANVDTGGRYTLLTVPRPIMGDWTLTFTGSKGDTVSIDLLSIYDLKLVFDLPRTTVEEAVFNWRLEDDNGVDIMDEYLIENIAPVLIITHTESGDTDEYMFPNGLSEMTLPMEAGIYEGYLSLDSYGIVRKSNAHRFEVPAVPPFTMPDEIKLNYNTYDVSMMTIFKPKAAIQLDDIVNFTIENRPLSVTEETGAWIDLVDWDYDPVDETINISALRPGKTEIKVIVSDPYEHSVDFYISVTITSGLIPIIIILSLLAAAAVGAVIYFQIKRPRLNDPMNKLGIKMTLPADIDIDYPPVYQLTLPGTQGQKSLRAVIDANIGASEPYRLSFEPIRWFADGTMISAKSKSILEIKVPAAAGYQIKIDNRTEKKSAAFDRNGGMEIRVGYEKGDGYVEYVITLGDPSGTGSFAMDDPRDWDGINGSKKTTSYGFSNEDW